MRQGVRRWTEAAIAARIREGYGSGEGTSYKPWIGVHDFSSRGRQTRMPVRALGRVVHTHSYIERAHLLATLIRPGLVDYREQFPCDRSITLGAAKAHGIRHPVYRNTNIPVVMTIDAVVHMRDAQGVVRPHAYDMKLSSHLENRRVREKLTLHRAYCEHVGMPHSLFTERSLPAIARRNISWLYGAEVHEDEDPQVHLLYETAPDLMLQSIAACEDRHTVASFAQAHDSRNAWEPGTSLRVFAWLFLTHRIWVDIAKAPIPQLPLPRPTTAETL